MFLFWLAAIKASPSPITDPASVQAQLQTVLQQPEFQDHEQFDLWERLSEWLLALFQSLQESFSQFKYAQELGNFSTFVMWSVLAIAMLALWYWGFRLWQARRALLDTAKPHPVGVRLVNPPESYEPRIREALVRKHWTTALQLSWLHFLSLLEARAWVHADRARTNREYLQQLDQHPEAAPVLEIVQHLVQRYDEFIYGGGTVEQKDWDAFRERLERAQLLLRLPPRVIPSRP